jgi:hypothetical protein
MSNNLSRHTLGLTELQSGQGAPSHQSNKGSFYIDVLTSNFYKNNDGSTSWQILVTTGSTDNYVTGGIFTGTTLTLYQQNGSVQVTGFTSENTFVTGFTYDNQNLLTISQNNGKEDLFVYLNQFSGLTVDNYINFGTNPSVPFATGGTLYYDYGENALSYKPITNQNDVTVNIGQESLIRIYNDTGVQINNGQVLHITGATNGIPTVALANASKLGPTFTDSLAQSSGVATHNIPNGEYGFITNFGIVRDLNTSGFTVGQELFLSDTIDGGITNDPNNINYTSRISTIGWCLSSDSTSGKIFVKIENENPLQSLTQQEINVLLGNTISTGAYSYTGMTKASSTTVNISPMRGWLVYNTYEYSLNPLVLNVYYSGGTNIPVTNINSSLDTYFLVNSGGTLYQQTTFPTPQERRQNIFLGRAVHPNKTDILNVEQTVDYDVSPLSSLRDLWRPIKLINEGVIPSNNGVNLQFKTSSGTFWGNGIGWDTNELNPNSITVPAYSPASFYYTTQTGGSFTVTANTIDTTNYDVNGIITNIPGAGNYVTQRIYMSQSGIIRVQYGQNYYSTLAKAIAAIPSETFVENSDNGTDCILIGLLTVKDGTTNLSNTDDAVFTLVSKFGEILGGTAGISTTTLQQAYNNSTTPEIVTDSTLGGLSIKNGTGNADNVTHLLEGINSSNVITSIIRADGLMSATTFYGSGVGLNNIPISGVTSLQSSLDSKFNISGGTVNGNVLVLGNVTILGSATTINTTTLSVQDNIVTLNNNATGNTAPFPINSGIEILRNSGTTTSILWEELNGYWSAGLNGSTKRIILEGDSLALLTSGHTHPISEINNLQSSLDFKLDLTGGTITNNINVLGSVSATTFYGNGQYLTGLVTNDFYVTGGTFSGTTLTLNRQNGSVTITGFTATGGGTFNGGTVTGSTNITGGLTANTINTPITNTQVVYSNSGTLTGSTNLTWVNSAATLTINGTLEATSKSFSIPHPTKEGKKLVYGSLEGPENGVYHRGKLYKEDTILLPEYWYKLVDKDTVTVHLTPIGKHQDLFVKEMLENKVIIGIEGGLFTDKTINCFYVVYGERKDINKLEIER